MYYVKKNLCHKFFIIMLMHADCTCKATIIVNIVNVIVCLLLQCYDLHLLCAK